MDVLLEAALGDIAPLAFIATEIVLPSRTLRLLDGSAAPISFSSMTFLSQDASWGAINLDDVQLSDGTANSVPAITLSLLPPSDDDAGDCLEACEDGSSVKLWLGAINRSTGQPIGAPELLFVGQIDVPTIVLGMNACAVSLAVTSIWDKVQSPDQKIALNGAWLKAYFPGVTGLDKVYLAARLVPWGAALPTTPTTTTALSPIFAAAAPASAPAQVVKRAFQ